MAIDKFYKYINDRLTEFSFNTTSIENVCNEEVDYSEDMLEHHSTLMEKIIKGFSLKNLFHKVEDAIENVVEKI